MEVVTPRTNTALLSSAEHMFAGLTLQANAADGSAVSLEVVADSEHRRFLVRHSRLKGSSGAYLPSSVLLIRRQRCGRSIRQLSRPVTPLNLVRTSKSPCAR